MNEAGLPGIIFAAADDFQRKSKAFPFQEDPFLIHWPTQHLEGCQSGKAASARQRLLTMQHPCWLATPPCTGCEVVDAGYVIWSMLSRVNRLGYGAQSQWKGGGGRDTKSVGVGCRFPCNSGGCRRLTWISHTHTHTHCVPFRTLLPGLLFLLWGQRRSRRPLCRCVFMPQLAADVPVHRKFGPQESCCRGTCPDSSSSSSGGRFPLNPESRRFSSPGLRKPPLHLPLWHDSDTMSDSSPWTVLSNFNTPHFFSGARLRRSKR